MNKVISEAKEIAGRLRTVRQELGMNQGEVATAASINQKTLSQWELGAIPESIPAFAAVALALKETPDSLLLISDGVENDLVRERLNLPTSLADDMMAMTRALIRMHHKAGPGVSPITLARHATESLEARFLGRLPVAPVAELQKSETPLDQQIEAIQDTLLAIVREYPAELPAVAGAERALHALTRPGVLPVRPAPHDSGSAARAADATSGSRARSSAPLPVDRTKKKKP